MNWRTWLAIPVIAALTGVVQAADTVAALEICDTCISESDFSNRALLIQPPYTTVYVSNRSETLKFERYFSQEDTAFGGSRLEIEVVPATISSVERGVIGEIIDRSQQDRVTVPRDRLDLARNSVIGDLQNARLDVAFLQNLATHLNAEGYAGRATDFSAGVRANIGFVSVNLSTKDQLRFKPLLVKVTYPDGSFVQLRIDPELAQFLDASIKDAAGNDIPVEDPTNVYSMVDPSGIDGRELIFNPSNPQFVENFIDALRARNNPPGGLSCSTELKPKGVALNCTGTP